MILPVGGDEGGMGIELHIHWIRVVYMVVGQHIGAICRTACIRIYAVGSSPMHVPEPFILLTGNGSSYSLSSTGVYGCVIRTLSC